MLAAGAGQRFGAGGQKLLAPWRGRPLLGHVLATIGQAREEGLLDRCLVVHAPGADSIRTLARAMECVPVFAVRAEEGLGASLRAGIVAMARDDAVLIFLGDQPAVRLETIRALVAAAAADPVHALLRPRYRSDPARPGHPVLVGRAYWPLAAQVAGDRGLDPVLRAAGHAWRLIDVDGANPDVDTLEDLERLDRS